MDKYKIIMSAKASNDFKRIVRYIKYDLQEPRIAEKYAKLISNKIKSLQYCPEKFQNVFTESENHKDIRKAILNIYSFICRKL